MLEWTPVHSIKQAKHSQEQRAMKRHQG